MVVPCDFFASAVNRQTRTLDHVDFFVCDFANRTNMRTHGTDIYG